MKVAFCGDDIDRADALRGDPDKLAALRGDALVVRLDGLAPELEGNALATDPLGNRAGELVFLGLRAGRALFAAVPAEGNSAPAYAQRPMWDMLALMSAADLALYGTARSVTDW
ncbi:MAG: NUDIX-like domain-containing protein, partial [Croceibacterium sp.]